MILKSFEEVKKIISEHPEASGVGYVVTPQLLKIAVQLGLVGYLQAFNRWQASGVFKEHVFDKYPPDATEEGEGDIKFAVQWEGNGIRAYAPDMIVVGLQALIADIELAIKEPENKLPEVAEAKPVEG